MQAIYFSDEELDDMLELFQASRPGLRKHPRGCRLNVNQHDLYEHVLGGALPTDEGEPFGLMIQKAINDKTSYWETERAVVGLLGDFPTTLPLGNPVPCSGYTKERMAELRSEVAIRKTMYELGKYYRKLYLSVGMNLSWSMTDCPDIAQLRQLARVA
jgi:hypothetical protein